MAVDLYPGVQSRKPVAFAAANSREPAALHPWQEQLIPRAGEVLAVRNLLRSHAQDSAFAEGCWDILLCLYLHEELTISHLTRLAGLPLTTTLRWLEQLEGQQLVSRGEKPGDRRAALIRMEQKARIIVETAISMIDRLAQPLLTSDRPAPHRAAPGA